MNVSQVFRIGNVSKSTLEALTLVTVENASIRVVSHTAFNPANICRTLLQLKSHSLSARA